MLRITIEMAPKGDESRAFTLAQGVIANDGTGTLGTGNYIYGFSGQASDKNPEPDIVMSGRLEGFSRLREDAWELLRQCIEQGDMALVAADGKDWNE